jgi:hypothetical protein
MTQLVHVKVDTSLCTQDKIKKTLSDIEEKVIKTLEGSDVRVLVTTNNVTIDFYDIF